MTTEQHPLYEKYDFYRLENMWLKLVLDAITELIEQKLMCDCQDCVLDVTALSLNRLTPNYWVSGTFNAIMPPDSFLGNKKNMAQAREAVVQSLAQVKNNPHH